jgi:hypothetical protein
MVWKPCNQDNQHYMGAIVGQEGAGKSSVALRMGELVDPNFDADNVFFHPVELIERLEGGVEKGTLFVFDEAGVELGNRTWYDSDQIEFNKVLQTIRNENAAVLFTLPVLDQLDVQAQTRLKGLISLHDRPYKGRGLVMGRYYEIDVDRVGHGKDDIYRIKPEVKVNGFSKTISRVGFRKPTESLMADYEATKQEFQSELYERVNDQFNGDGGSGDDSLSPKQAAQEILDEGRVDDVVSIHGGNGTEYIDQDLIALEYPELSVRDAKQAKKVLQRSSEVNLNE